ncbi:LTA synthase family protein [Capnocytophaga stomatis]|uniref:LTA synthase family protein n=1 Tax=Capnocytophaga stomatis TaxID=1848904 RepID=UPI00194F1A6B|nr:alkaline phosphatase family protein [Capnocytophaga stomatis]
MNLSLFGKVISSGLKYFAYFFLFFLINRFVFLYVYGNYEQLLSHKTDLVQAFLMGGRFDISVICYGFLPLALFWLISLFIKKSFSQKFENIYLNFCKYYLLFALFVFTSLQIIDFFFYQFFQSHINILFFGIFNDDTSAVLHSVWTDYPILMILLVFTLVFISFLVFHKFIYRSFQQNTNRISKTASICLLLIFPSFIIGMRGSLGVFTLQRDHTNVSSNTFINSLCYNAAYALRFAYVELEENHINPDIEKTLQNSGFSSFNQVKEAYQQPDSNLFDSEMYARTQENDFLKKNPPNVIFFLMESMSNHYFELHSEKLNLLGDLAPLLSDLYYFKNCLSSHNGTIGSLENLMINTPKGIVAQSPYFDVSFSSSVAKPFKEQGYETMFITGANPSWRNVDNFIKHQDFDVIEGSSHIINKIPNAETFAWGVHDGYLFDYIAERLSSPSEKPRFIFSLTVSNHTPYEVPLHYKPYSIDIKSLEETIRVDKQMASDNFYAHQYAASQLAKFIAFIKNSPLGKNTIIAVTGDHNIRQVFEYDSENAFLQRSVPILFYVPEDYKPLFFDANVMASHKDIFPTLFHLSLSNQEYVYSGDNMFSESLSYRFGVNDYNFIADSLGVLSVESQKPLYFTWKDEKKRKLTPDNSDNPHAQFMLNKLRSFETLQTLKIYTDIKNQKK